MSVVFVGRRRPGAVTSAGTRRFHCRVARFGVVAVLGVGLVLITLHHQILALAPDYQCQEVDQRYGELVWGCTAAPSVTPAINALVWAAEAESRIRCERCGKPGRLMDRQGWLTTLCPDCSRGRGYRPATTRRQR